MSHVYRQDAPGTQPFRDPRLLPGMAASKTITGEIELIDKSNWSQRLLVAPVFLALTLASMSYAYDSWRSWGSWGNTGNTALDIGQACVAFSCWALFGALFWLAAGRQVLVVGPNAIEVRSETFGVRRSTRHADGRILLERVRGEHGDTFVLTVVQQSGSLTRAFYERGYFPADHGWPQQLISFGSLLHDITGWAFDIPDDIRVKM